MLRVSLCHPAERVALGRLHMSVLQLTVELVHCALLLGLALREVLQTDKQGSVLVIVTLIAGIPRISRSSLVVMPERRSHTSVPASG